MREQDQTPKCNQRHGGPWDRGAADKWYSRGKNPHYYEGATYSSKRVEECDMTTGEIEQYNLGYGQSKRKSFA